MQNNNGEEQGSVLLHQACAACKHQRKRCQKTCVLAPFFPPSKTHEFEAVHKVFGLRNIQKMVGCLETKAQRQRAIESFIWEANFRQYNPVCGPLAEFERVLNELNLLKSQQISVLAEFERVSNELNLLKSQQISVLAEFERVSNELNLLKSQQQIRVPEEEDILYMGMDMRVNNNAYIHGNRNLISESDHYGVTHQPVVGHETGNPIIATHRLQSIDGLNQHSVNSVNPHYYYPDDQFSQMNVGRTLGDPNWDGGS